MCVLPSFGATNPQITKLIKEKQQKYAQLEQCSKKVNGFKIAGISTLGLTAVGIGGNIALASKNKQLDKEINGTNGEGGLRSDLTKEQEKLEQKNAEIAAEKLKIQQKQDCDARGDNWEWTVTGCKEKTDNSNSGNSNQNSGGNNQNQVNVSNSSANNVNATVVQSEKPQQETIVDGRIVGSTCVDGDLSSNAATGHYIKLARRFTKDKDGWDSKRCYSDSEKEQIVDCSCAADSCKNSNYEVSNGICVKKAAATPQETTEKNTSLNTPNMDEYKALTLKSIESLQKYVEEVLKQMEDKWRSVEEECDSAVYDSDYMSSGFNILIPNFALSEIKALCEDVWVRWITAEARLGDVRYLKTLAEKTDNHDVLEDIRYRVDKQYELTKELLSNKELLSKE